MEAYLESNTFLTSINNEIALSRNSTYKDNFQQLNKLVLVIFQKDKTVVPKESSWFGSAQPTEDEESQFESNAQRPLSDLRSNAIIPMRLQPLYREDWIGLRALDERGDVVFEACSGEHMQLTDCWKPIVKLFCGGEM
jgi:palmitoyl-protein thioesterase